MALRDYFPLGIASDFAFCNRTQETELLVENIKSCKHTLLLATRRYGKSSLALHALEASGLPYTEIDFYMASSEKAIESYILNGVTEAIGKALGPVDKLLTSIKRYLKNIKPKLDIGAANLKLELTVDDTSDPAANVKEALLLLEQLLKEKQKRAVLLMDEFQNVGLIAKGKGIEGAIRHVAQKTKYLTFIFSGSNRHLLQMMFNDETRPLYKLCWHMNLTRISSEDYHAHLQKAAKAAWQRVLVDEVINCILSLSEKHPYYVNKLCDRLWTYCQKQVPTIKDVQETWAELIEEERSDAIKEISLLSAGQKRVLLQIAKGTTSQFTGKHAMMELEMGSSSILTALEALEEKDIVEKISDRYQIINPIVKFYVLK
jgi:AAA+ ATPase superfamily predicted ATPase